MRPRRRRDLLLRHPARLIAVAFAGAIAVGTGLLLLPPATAGDGTTPLITAVFTATSAVCVTGLVVVDTPTHWTGFGQGVILFLIQLGGFGIITLASLVALLVSRRIGLRGRLVTQQETAALQVGDVRRVVVGVAKISAAFEAAATVLLAARFWQGYDEPFGRAVWLGLFHAVSAFNNAGFALWSDSLSRFVTDSWVTLVVAATVIAGGLGFPVFFDLGRHRGRWRHWTIHTKLTLSGTAVLIVGGSLAVLFFEWSNGDTLGSLSVPGKAVAGFFQGITPRTAGFNTLDYSAMRETTWLATLVLMFIGGGSASAAGGIKVTTFFVLGFVIWAELRGDPDVTVFRRRIPTPAQRQALAIALLGVGAVVAGTLVLMGSSRITLARSLFEAVSAFGTVGLSTGVTDAFPVIGELTLIALMYVGRIGPITVFAALVLRERQRLYRLAEERPIVG